MINSRITGDDKRHAGVGSRVGSPNGVVVYDRPLFSKTPLRAFFADEFGSTALNITNTAIADATRIYDGGDSALFTATPLSGGGRWDTTSTAQAYAGSQSLSGANARNNDTVSLSSGTDYDSSQFTALDMYVYLTQWPTTGTVKEIELELWSNGVQASSVILVRNYVDITALNTWQLCSVPFNDFNILTPTWDEVRIRFRDTGSGQAPRAYFDEIAMQGLSATGTVDYVFSPASDEIVDVRKIVLSGAAASPKLKFDEFFGIPALSNGLILTARSNGAVVDSQVVRDNFRLVELANSTLRADSETVENTTIYRSVSEFSEDSLILDGRTSDELRITVRDDLSDLSRLSATVEAYRVFTDFN